MAPRNARTSVSPSAFCWEASAWPTFLHLDIFDSEWTHVGLDDGDLLELQSAILEWPQGAPVVRGTEGLRKIRFAPSREARGKRGAYRVGYVLFREFGFILLVTVWGKKEKSDLSLAERSSIARVVREIRQKLAK